MQSARTRSNVICVGLAVLLLIGTVGLVETPCPETAVGATPNPITNITQLHKFLSADRTDETEYIFGTHDCMEFSVILASNLIAAGYDAGCVMTQPDIKSNDSRHMMAYVMLDAQVMIIEPQHDSVVVLDHVPNSTMVGELNDSYVTLMPVDDAEDIRLYYRNP